MPGGVNNYPHLSGFGRADDGDWFDRPQQKVQRDERLSAGEQPLGRRRIARLFDWLIDANLAMKSTGAMEKLELEKLVVRLAPPRAG